MGITHPSVKGQERVVRAAYKRANLDPNKTAYVECHGTGTPVSNLHLNPPPLALISRAPLSSASLRDLSRSKLVQLTDSCTLLGG